MQLCQLYDFKYFFYPSINVNDLYDHVHLDDNGNDKFTYCLANFLKRNILGDIDFNVSSF